LFLNDLFWNTELRKKESVVENSFNNYTKCRRQAAENILRKGLQDRGFTEIEIKRGDKPFAFAINAKTPSHIDHITIEEFNQICAEIMQESGFHLEKGSFLPQASRELPTFATLQQQECERQATMSTPPTFDEMNGHEFERFCVKLLLQNGFDMAKKTAGSGDFGVDILAEKDGITYAIQCKCLAKDVGNTAVQEIFSGREYHKSHIGAVLTNRYFTKAAKNTAKRTGIILWDRDWLLARLPKKEEATPLA